MKILFRFSADARGSAYDKIALICAAISVACVFGAKGLDRMAQNGSLPVIALNWTNRDVQVDYAPTASIAQKAQGTNLNPCNGQTR